MSRRRGAGTLSSWDQNRTLRLRLCGEDIHLPTYQVEIFTSQYAQPTRFSQNTAENRDGAQHGVLARIPQGGTRMNFGSELKLARDHAGLSTEPDNVLNSFAPENDFIVPPRHAAHDPLARDIHFTYHPPVPLAPTRAARGRLRRALTLLALFGTAGWGAYVYQSSHPLDLDTVSAWVSRLKTLAERETRAAATAPREARPNVPTKIDPPLASNESAVSPDADRKADTGNASGAKSDITRPVAPPPPTIGTSGSLASPIENVKNVSGGWRLDTLTETGDSSFEGLKLHYEMKLTQDGDRVAGVGTKVSENEKGTGPAAQTPVTMTGTIAGDRLTLNFVELGTRPETRGKIVILIDEAGTLRGRFSSNATPSSGHVEGRRVLTAEPLGR